MTDAWSRTQALFDEAMELDPPERVGFVRDAPYSEEVRSEVLALLDAEQAMGSFLEEGLSGSTSEVLDALAGEGPDLTGRVFGAFRAERLIGHGGTSVVYLGQRVDPTFEQQVALKVFRPGGEPKRVRARFAAERRILASLSHPDLARLYDAGVDEAGQPYLVVELVDGEPITEYAQRNSVSLDRRVGLFLRVADAVAYAHRSLVVHQDLKPSNIFVTADGHVKLLDFGIAKLVSQNDAEEASDGWMTPAYAAPEQLRGEAITTSTDVHALGLLLYELVHDRRPARDEHGNPTVEERRVVGLRRASDLAAIIRRATEGDPDVRYASAAEMATDVRRWVTGHAVEARKPTPSYLFTRFISRHRFGVAVASALATLVVGAILALSVERSATMAAAAEARVEAEKAQAVVDFLGEVFRGRDPSIAPNDTVTALQLVEWGESRIEEEFGDRPEVAVEILQVLGQAYANLGLEERAIPVLNESVRLRRATFGDTSPETASGLIALARELQRFRAFDEALPAASEAMSILTQVHGPDAWETANAYHVVANSLRERAQPDSAIALMERVLAIGRLRAIDDDIDLDALSLNLAYMMRRVGRNEEAEPLYRVGIASLRGYATPMEVSPHLNNLAYLLRLKGDYLGADTLYREAFATQVDVVGRGHPTTLLLAQNLAGVWTLDGRVDEAIALLRESVDAAAVQFGDPHWRLGSAWYSIGATLLEAGRIEDAVAPLRASASQYDASLGADHEWSVFAQAEVHAAEFAAGLRPDAPALSQAERYAAYWQEEQESSGLDLLRRLLLTLQRVGLDAEAARFSAYLPEEERLSN